MCFYSLTHKAKIAKKPIKVWKALSFDYCGPVVWDYKYERGINRPVSKDSKYKLITNKGEYVYTEGWLHVFKFKKRPKVTPNKVLMFIPKGFEYLDEGSETDGSMNQIISSGLYWPKNRFDYIKWYIKSIF